VECCTRRAHTKTTGRESRLGYGLPLDVNNALIEVAGQRSGTSNRRLMCLPLQEFEKNPWRGGITRVRVLFSKRHRQNLLSGNLELKIPRPTRRRLWYVLADFDEPLRVYSSRFGSLTENSSVLQELYKELVRHYGDTRLRASDETGQYVEVDDLQPFVLHGYPGRVLDVFEALFETLSSADEKLDLQRKTNEVLIQDECPWLLANGYFVKVDAEFLGLEVLNRT